jgi:hypothetical protein
MNVLDDGDALRARCHRHVLHVAPAASEKRRLITESGREPKPGNSNEDGVVSWHPTLTRFGADTLNKRYRARENAPMSSEAWAGWFAIKCAWEATLRSKASTADELVSYLERETTRFDGHKGSALYFDRRHQLVQPLYIVRGGAVVSETSTERVDHPDECTWR